MFVVVVVVYPKRAPVDKMSLINNTKVEKSPSELLIEREEKGFLRRLERELTRMAEERIEFTLPAAVIDHVAKTDRN